MLKKIFLTFFILFIPYFSFAAETDWLNPTSFGLDNWTNPGFAFTDDNNYANGGCNGADETFLNFNIPTIATGSIIDGFFFRLKGKRNTVFCIPDGGVPNISLSWNGGSNYTSPEYYSGLQFFSLTTETTAYLGTSTTKFGRTWSASELSNNNFIVQVDSWGFYQQLYDEITLKVFYTTPVSSTIQYVKINKRNTAFMILSLLAALVFVLIIITIYSSKIKK